MPPDETSPVLPDENRAAKVERLEQGAHPGDVSCIRIVFPFAWLIGAPEADEIGRNRSVSRGSEVWNHLAIEIRPRGLAVKTEQWARRSVTFVEIVHAQYATGLAGIDLGVMGSEAVARQVREALVRCP